jgi:hypothetical protein
MGHVESPKIVVDATRRGYAGRDNSLSFLQFQFFDLTRINPKSIEQDFPHIVETIVPLSGFGKTLDAMLEFHTRNGIRAINSTGRRDENGRDYIRWCFADPALAAAFAKEFDAQSK